jgi:hypothetical protein
MPVPEMLDHAAPSIYELSKQNIIIRYENNHPIAGGRNLSPRLPR